MTAQIASLNLAKATQSLVQNAIPVTCDQGDALNAAHQILGASTSYCFSHTSIVPWDVYLTMMHAKNHIGKQYTAWLKGGEA